MYLIPQAWQSPNSALPAAGIACHLSLGLRCLSQKARSGRAQKVCSLVLSHKALLVAESRGSSTGYCCLSRRSAVSLNSDGAREGGGRSGSGSGQPFNAVLSTVFEPPLRLRWVKREERGYIMERL